MLTSVSRYFKDNLVGFLALFVALGGTGAYAANEWNSSNIQDETLTGADVKGRVGTYEDPAVNGSLTTYDIAGHAANAGNGTRFIDGSLTGQDVKDNSLVGADVNESTFNLAAEPWHEVGSAGEPAFNAPFAAGGCSWSNYGPTTAAFLRDRFGFVHLKGVVRVRDGNTYACGQWAPDPTIFYLPGCYSPAVPERHSTITNSQLGRIDIGVGGNQNAVEIVFPPASFADAKEWVSLDGITFRGRSGQNCL